MTGHRKYWKSCARNSLRGKWGLAVGAMVAVQAVSVLGNLLSWILFPGDGILHLILGEIFVFVVSLIGAVFSTGYCHMRLNICRGREYGMKDLVYAFRNQPDHVLVAAIVVALLSMAAQIPTYLFAFLTDPGSTAAEIYVWLKLMLAVVVLSAVLSIVLTAPFVLTFYLLADDPEMGGLEALKSSMHHMKGHILQYLALEISFIPLIFLSMFTMCFGFFLLLPYMDFTETSFYMYVTGEFEQKNNSSEGEYNGYYSGNNQ